MPSEFDRDFLLKAVQAWLNLKLKIAGYVVIANAAALATAVAVLKDKPTSTPASEALKVSSAGLFAGAVAVAVIGMMGESVLERMIKFAPAKNRTIDAAKIVHPVVSISIWLLVMASFLCFTLGIAFLQGYTDGGIMCENNPLECIGKSKPQTPAAPK